MKRRTYLTSASVVGGMLVAGCATTGSGGPSSSPTASGKSPTDRESPTDVGTTERPAAGDLGGATVRSSGTGSGTSDKFTALGGPVIITATFDYSGMKNSNFIAYPVDEHGDAHSKNVLAHPFHLNHLFAPEQHPDVDSYTARLVTSFEPGEYYIEVSHAGGPYGNGKWELVIQQPGIPTSGAALPLTVEGRDTDVIGPIAVDGPVRVTVETLETRLGSDGQPSTFNYFVWMTDEIGTEGERHINSLGPAPETLSAVWFPEADATVGYFNVQSFGAWRATVEAA